MVWSHHPEYFSGEAPVHIFWPSRYRTEYLVCDALTVHLRTFDAVGIIIYLATQEQTLYSAWSLALWYIVISNIPAGRWQRHKHCHRSYGRNEYSGRERALRVRAYILGEPETQCMVRINGLSQNRWAPPRRVRVYLLTEKKFCHHPENFFFEFGWCSALILCIPAYTCKFPYSAPHWHDVRVPIYGSYCTDT